MRNRPETNGFRKPIDSGKRKPVGLAIIKYGQTEQGVEFAECSCGKPFTHRRERVRENQIDRHINAKHHGKGIRL